LRVEISSYKADNDNLIEAQEGLARDKEKQVEFNAMILQSLS